MVDKKPSPKEYKEKFDSLDITNYDDFVQVNMFKTPDFGEWYDNDELAIALKNNFENDIKTDDDFCKRLWSSLANVNWIHGENEHGYSFRSAGDVIASIRGDGHYMDWYCSGPDGVVDGYIAETMFKNGWTYRV